MTSRAPTQCRACVHYRLDGTCDAFPDGIPVEIILQGADHRDGFTGDGGVRFEQKPGSVAAEDFANWDLVFG